MSSPIKFVQGALSYNTGYFAPGQPTSTVLKLKPGDVSIADFHPVLLSSGTDCEPGGHASFTFYWTPGDGVTNDMTLQIQEVVDGAVTGSFLTLTTSPRTQPQPHANVLSLQGYDAGSGDPHTIQWIWRLTSQSLNLQATASYTQTIYNNCGTP